jgi:acetyl esterase/lipase
VQVDRAIIYAEREGFRALELDVYRPSSGTADVPVPAVVYIHGGGWRVSHRSRAPRETREWERGFFQRIVEAGFLVVAPDYRLSGEAIFPAQRDDVLTAMAWVRGQATALGIDADRSYLWGASGGGLLAALAALIDVPPVAGVVCWYPVTDLLALDQEATESFEAHLLGGPIGQHRDLAVAASPVSHVHPDAPPFLLQHGDADTWVPCDQSVRLAERLQRAGVRFELEVVPGADHFFDGAPDVEAIFDRALRFLLDLDADRRTGDR